MHETQIPIIQSEIDKDFTARIFFIPATTQENRFSSVQDFFKFFNIQIPTKTRPHNLEWRLTPRILGQISGLPASRGILCATNGILCYIDQGQSYSILPYCGHVQWFSPDDKDIDMFEVKHRFKRPQSREGRIRVNGEKLLQEIESLGY